ncbi:MAG: hypothetical protein IJQ08_05180 [Synergistaceae bacterium]|nr:hypothetical protein [Synergistaceae bacterium]
MEAATTSKCLLFGSLLGSARVTPRLFPSALTSSASGYIAAIVTYLL